MALYGRTYKGTFAGVSFTGGAARDIWELKADTDHVIGVTSIFVGNYGTTQFGDASAQGMWPRLIRASGSFTSGSGGTAYTPEDVNGSATTFGGVLEGHNSTPATVASGTFVTLENEVWHLQAGWFYKPTPQEMIIIKPGETLIVTFPDDGTLNPSGDAPKITSTITFEVVGGL